MIEKKVEEYVDKVIDGPSHCEYQVDSNQYPEGVRGIGNGNYPGDVFYACSTTTGIKEV